MLIERIFTTEKIFTTIMEITAIGRGAAGGDLGDMRTWNAAAVEFAANAAWAARVGVGPGGGKCYPTTGGTMPRSAQY
jgi:hypothetical protein